MAWMSATAAKSRYLRQMNGDKLAQQRLAGRDVAGAGPRLDHGGALPVLSDALVVVERRRGRDRDLRRARIGPQPQIGAEHIAVGGALLQQLHQPRVSRTKNGAGSTPAASIAARRVVEHDEIDVARIVELARAHLAHGEHDVAAAASGRAGSAGRSGRARRVGEEMAHRGADRRIGELGQRRVTRIIGHTPPMSASAISSAASAFMRRSTAA